MTTYIPYESPAKRRLRLLAGRLADQGDQQDQEQTPSLFGKVFGGIGEAVGEFGRGLARAGTRLPGMPQPPEPPDLLSGTQTQLDYPTSPVVLGTQEEPFASRAEGIPGVVGRMAAGFVTGGLSEPPLTLEELANPLTAAMLAVPPAGALGVTAERAAAEALAGRTVRKAVAGVQAAVGKPEAAIRTRFGEAAAKEVGGAEPVYLTLFERPQRIKRFTVPALEGERATLDAQLENAGFSMDAIAGLSPDEYFIVVEPPKMRPGGTLPENNVQGFVNGLRDLGASDEAQVKIGTIAQEASRRAGQVGRNELGAPIPGAPRSGGFLYFGSMDDVRQFFRTGDYKAPTLQFHANRPGAPALYELGAQPTGQPTPPSRHPALTVRRGRTLAVEQKGVKFLEDVAEAQRLWKQIEDIPAAGESNEVKAIRAKYLAFPENVRAMSREMEIRLTPDAEMLAARQARAAEVARGQAEMSLQTRGVSSAMIPPDLDDTARSLYQAASREMSSEDLNRALTVAREEAKAAGRGNVGVFYMASGIQAVQEPKTTLVTEPVRPVAQPSVQPPIREAAEPVAEQVGKAQAPTPTQQVVPLRPVGPSSAEVPSLVAKPPSPPAVETPEQLVASLRAERSGPVTAPSHGETVAPGDTGVPPPAQAVGGGIPPPTGGIARPPAPPPPPTAGGTQLPPSGDSWIPGVRSNDAIIGMAYRNDWTRSLADQAARVPGLGKVAQVVGLPERNVFKQAEVLRAGIMADWDSNSTGVIARLRSVGDSTALFSVDKDGRALIGGDRVALNDVLEHPAQFALTERQTQFIQRLHKINDDKLARLTEEGIDVPQLSFEEGGHYVGRRVLGRLDNQGNLEMAQTGAGARRVGAKAAFEKPRVFEQGTEEAIAAGYRYMKPEDVMQANLQAAGRRIADQRFSEFILDQVPYRTGAAPSELTVARDAAQQKLRRAVKLGELVNRSIRGETPPQATLSAVARSYPEEIEQLRSALGDASALKQIRPVAADSIRAAQAVYRDAASALSHAQRIVRTTRLGEGTVQAPAFAGKMFDAKDADAINKAMGLAPLPLWASTARGVAWLNAPFRMLITTYDVGVSGIQLLMTMFKNPVVWGKATGRGLEALVSGKGYQQFLANHAETISKWSPHGAIFTPSEFTEAIRPGGLVARIPVLRSTARPFERYFEGILNAAEIYGLEAKDALRVGPLRVGKGAASGTSAEMADWASHWNVMTGRLDSSRRGISQAQQYVESAVGFAPRFRRAAYTLMTDIARGGVRGEQSREALAKFLLGGTFGYIGLAYALGQEPVLDPGQRGKWMTFDIAGQRVGLGSAYVITLRLLGQVAQDIADGQPQKIAGDAGRYAKGLLAPVPGISVDVAFSPNFGRDGIQRALQLTQRVAANNLIPGWAGALLDSRAVDWESRAVGAGAQSLSLRSFPAKTTPSPSVPQPVSSRDSLSRRRALESRHLPAGAR